MLQWFIRHHTLFIFVQKNNRSNNFDKYYDCDAYFLLFLLIHLYLWLTLFFFSSSILSKFKPRQKLNNTFCCCWNNKNSDFVLKITLYIHYHDHWITLRCLSRKDGSFHRDWFQVAFKHFNSQYNLSPRIEFGKKAIFPIQEPKMNGIQFSFINHKHQKDLIHWRKGPIQSLKGIEHISNRTKKQEKHNKQTNKKFNEKKKTFI